MGKVTRRSVLAGVVAAAVGTLVWSRTRKPPLGMDIPESFLERGAALLRESPAVDVHGHPGRSFLAGADPDSPIVRLMPDGFEDERITGMIEAGVTASVFAIVADLAILGITDGGLQVVREFEPGEAYADYRRQLARLETVIGRGRIAPALTPDDIRSAHSEGRPVAILASEGADFAEGDTGRIAEAHAAGLRCVTLVHYNTNRLGDTQTSAPVHGGLTAFGQQVVREMNRLGMIVDVAHASFATARGAIAESRAPVLLSHTDLDTGPVKSPRFVSLAHARAVTEAGGVIGAWPAGIGSKSLADFVEQVMALVNAVGAEHVAIGSDMDGNYKPVLTEYADFPLLAAALLYRGLSERDAARVLGTNFLRLFDEVAGAASAV
ncbi:MAG TPA: membrane dipeptidase [Woeseiaceae bacterium]|nr:membrane dipeptidase [Woeseiaceae bacterium]